MTISNPQIRIFQRNGLKLDKDLIFSGLVQNDYVYQMAKSKKIWPSRFSQFNSKVGKKCMGFYGSSKKGAKTVELWLIVPDWD